MKNTHHSNKDIVWHDHKITKEDRIKLSGNKPAILWFTGLSGSGKSTIANATEELLYQLGVKTYLLDGDNIRHGLNKDLGFSDEDRIENIRRIGEVAKLFVDSGTLTLTAFISPFRAERQMVRELVDAGEFIEIFIDTPLEICEQRDPKGLYKKARNGKIKNFTGIDSDYEAPLNPEITIKTAEKSIEVCAKEIIDHLINKGIIHD